MRYRIVPLLLILKIGISAEPVEVIPPQNKVLSSQGGRYVFGQIYQMRKDQYLLDTQTGRMWVMVADKDGNPMLQSIYFATIFNERFNFPESMDECSSQDQFLRADTIKKMHEAPNKKNANAVAPGNK